MIRRLTLCSYNLKFTQRELYWSIRCFIRHYSLHILTSNATLVSVICTRLKKGKNTDYVLVKSLQVTNPKADISCFEGRNSVIF